MKSEKEKHLSSLPDQMSRLSFDTNVIQSLSKKVDEINASNNNVTEAIKALNENTFKMSQTLQNTSEMLQRSSASNKDLSQSISTLTQRLAVQNASDNTSSVKKKPGSHNVQTTPTNLPTSNRFAVLADLNDSIQEEGTKESRKILIMGNSHIRNIKTRYFIK